MVKVIKDNRQYAARRKISSSFRVREKIDVYIGDWTRILKIIMKNYLGSDIISVALPLNDRILTIKGKFSGVNGQRTIVEKNQSPIVSNAMINKKYNNEISQLLTKISNTMPTK
jgi:hypothetical protein